MLTKKESSKPIIILGLIFILVGFILSAYTNNHPKVAKFGNVVIAEIQYPLIYLTKFSLGFVGDVFENYFNLLNVKGENTKLKEQVLRLEAKNLELLETKKENTRLKDILSFKTENNFEGIVAEVFSISNQVQSRTIIINKGLGLGVKQGAAVVKNNNLIGQVINVNLNTSKVLLLNDLLSSVDALSSESRVRGIISGNDNGSLELKFVLSDVKLVIGERILTSGLDGVFPKGIFIGVVKQISFDENLSMFQKIEVEPNVDFRNLETVFVLNKKYE